MTSNIVGHPIVVGVDGSVSAMQAASWAANEAALRGLPLRLVHGVQVSALANISRPASARLVETLNSAGRQYLTEARALVQQARPGLNVDVDLQRADPLPMLIDLSETARLVVVGSRGSGGFSGILVGATAAALAAHGHCPIAVIRGPASGAAPPTQGPVVVGVDGSPASEAAIALAFEEASMRNADLIAVHTWIDFSDDYSYTYARQLLTDWDRIETEERELLAQRLAGWQEKYPDVRVHCAVTRDRPVHHLLEHGAHAQLLVVGSRGRGGISGMLLGSTSHALIHHAPCPLLVARPITTP